MTKDLDRRIAEHNKGMNKSIKKFMPWRIIHVEKFSTRSEARTREKYFKSAAGRTWRKKNLTID
jgi:putative endonuclease